MGELKSTSPPPPSSWAGISKTLVQYVLPHRSLMVNWQPPLATEPTDSHPEKKQEIKDGSSREKSSPLKRDPADADFFDRDDSDQEKIQEPVPPPLSYVAQLTMALLEASPEHVKRYLEYVYPHQTIGFSTRNTDPNVLDRYPVSILTFARVLRQHRDPEGIFSSQFYFKPEHQYLFSIHRLARKSVQKREQCYLLVLSAAIRELKPSDPVQVDYQTTVEILTGTTLWYNFPTVYPKGAHPLEELIKTAIEAKSKADFIQLLTVIKQMRDNGWALTNGIVTSIGKMPEIDSKHKLIEILAERPPFLQPRLLYHPPHERELREIETWEAFKKLAAESRAFKALVESTKKATKPAAKSPAFQRKALTDSIKKATELAAKSPASQREALTASIKKATELATELQACEELIHSIKLESVSTTVSTSSSSP